MQRKQAKPNNSRNTKTSQTPKVFRKPRSRLPKNQSHVDSSNQVLAILLFAFSVLLFFLIFVEGENIWRFLHKIIWGLFGVSSILWPIISMSISIIISAGKSDLKVINKFCVSTLLVLFCCSATYVFSSDKSVDMSEYFKTLIDLYNRGINKESGGIFSGLIAIPLFCAFGVFGSRILIAVVIFVAAMILTGASLVEFLLKIKKPLDAIVRTFENSIESKKNRSFNIDVPLNPILPSDSAKYKEKSISLDEASNKSVADDNLDGSDSSALMAAMELSQKQSKKQSKVTALDIEFDNSFLKEQDHFNMPPASLLDLSPHIDQKDVAQELQINGQMLVDTLNNFGVQTRIINISRGPAVTRYELQPAAGVKISKITNLSDDIALNLAASGVRIEAPIPGKSAVGIEIPNKIISIVKMRELILSKEFSFEKSKLTVILGRNITGNVAFADLAKMPHLLIAGSTGSGKSVCINSFLISLLYKANPNEVRFLMIDPKVVELGVYNGIPHLLVPVVTDPRKAAGALSWAVSEMLKRYKIFADNNVRDLASYNKMVGRMAQKKQEIRELFISKISKFSENKNQSVKSSDANDNKNENVQLESMPQIVIIIDELADLMMAAPREVEDSICRLAQMARAAGMHLVIATQRPSVDVITGIIKANIPSRVALAVSSQIDSRTILDTAGAEKLLGCGDMLFSPIGVQKPIRIQGCFVSDKEIESVINFIKQTRGNEYNQEVIDEIEKNAVLNNEKERESKGFEEEDPMFKEAVKCVVELGQASTSLLQRRLRLGYARAGRIIDQMEQNGIIGPHEGSKPRQVLISKQEFLEMSLSDTSCT
ncbi:MAG: DNA translocase FtsK [Oscillospiraceae bacterium]|nr:DNA translocase FtsK [Oscillospiraceae bacterium]